VLVLLQQLNRELRTQVSVVVTVRTDAGVCHICAPTVAAVWLILLCLFPLEFVRLMFAVCCEFGTMCGCLLSLQYYSATDCI